jgi:Glycosyl transferase family 11
MILFYGEGRLGNQILQYLALARMARPGEHIVAIGLENLQQNLKLRGPRLRVVSRNALIKRAVKYLLLPLLIRPCARLLRLFDYVSEERTGGKPRRQRGAITQLTFVDGGYYQSASLWDRIFPSDHISISDDLRRSAQDYLVLVGRQAVRPSFVHVRRGDYLLHRPQGMEDVVLPLAYYRRALHELESRAGKKPLIFVTDDPKWVEDNFRDIPDKIVTALDARFDFAIMTQCGSGILSNSTFALAAAIMMQSPEVVIAPRFWLGFRARRWVPEGIHAAHEKLVYIDAEVSGQLS